MLLHRGAALSSEASDIDSTAVLSADGRRQGSIGVQLDESALGRIPMAALAQLVRLSRYYFCRSFKRSFGFLPRGYRIGLRIEARPEGTPGQASTKDLAVMIDFVATGSFTAAFVRAGGCSHRRLIASSLVAAAPAWGFPAASWRWT